MLDTVAARPHQNHLLGVGVGLARVACGLLRPQGCMWRAVSVTAKGWVARTVCDKEPAGTPNLFGTCRASV